MEIAEYLQELMAIDMRFLRSDYARIAKQFGTEHRYARTARKRYEKGSGAMIALQGGEFPAFRRYLQHRGQFIDACIAELGRDLDEKRDLVGSTALAILKMHRRTIEEMQSMAKRMK
jgi:hypothetical protein